MTDHPITPPPELVKQWAISSPIQHSDELWVYELFIARQASRWGADQELEACCEHLKRIWSPSDTIDSLRAARRPKPPSLKEQALMALEDGDIGPGASLTPVEVCIIRRALEQLPE